MMRMLSVPHGKYSNEIANGTRRGVKKVPKDHASRVRGGPGSALLNVASLAPRGRLAFADD